MSRAVANIPQLNPRRSGELGVEAQHFDGKCDLVNHSLARSMTAGEKFQVLGPVVGSDAVDVVDGFFRVERPADNRLHDVSVFKYIARRFSIFARHNHSDVPVLGRPFGDFLVWIVGLVSDASEGGPTSGAAQALLAVNRTAGAALDGHRIAALDATYLPIRIGQAATKTAAFRRAVQRVFVPLLSVGADAGRLHGKRSAALSAGECRGLNTGILSSVHRLVLNLTRSTTEPLGRIARSNPEVSSAFLAKLLNWHGSVSFEWGQTYHGSLIR